jgi:AAA+ ATPase superfamily predicted ATPase
MRRAFLNRHRELRALEEAIRSSRAEMVIVYGRRGVGKSALMQHALQQTGWRYIYYRATRRTLPLQMAAMRDCVAQVYPEAYVPVAFASVEDFLTYLAHLAAEQQEPLLFVIDELPYLVEADPSLLSVLQHWWDAHKGAAPIKMFLLGSTLAFMERQVLDVGAPLYHRRTRSFRLEPMDYADAALFFPKYSAQQKMEAYAILGGMPLYLEQFDPEQDIEQNVIGAILQSHTFLSEEPEWLLLEEFRRDLLYSSILRAVAAGHRRPSDIANAIGKGSAQDIAVALEKLQQLGLIVREVPVTERSLPRSRRSLYYLADEYLNFWYRFVDPYSSVVARGMGRQVWAQHIAPNLSHFVSRPAFERACRQYVWRAVETGKLSLPVVAIGAWWGTGGREIDVVAVDAQYRLVLAGSCKWTADPLDLADYVSLQKDVHSAEGELRPIANPTFALFSRTGFTSRLRQLAEAEGERLLLVDLQQLYEAQTNWLPGQDSNLRLGG